MVCTERAETAAVSRGTSHVTTKLRCKYTTSVDIQNSDSFHITCDKSAVNLLESGEQCYNVKAIMISMCGSGRNINTCRTGAGSVLTFLSRWKCCGSNFHVSVCPASAAVI